MNSYKNQNRLFLFTIVFSLFFFNIGSSPSYNYIKGGEDWTGACKGGNQSPIDLSGPFEYKSINK